MEIWSDIDQPQRFFRGTNIISVDGAGEEQVDQGWLFFRNL